ncbi:MAG: branched-chain amino acid transaminase [Chloroflexota bacterium]|nr:branched-chain amino acid transaminase [Chloroflexota bacterium]
MTQQSKHPAYIWWNGKYVAWDDATVHVTELGWSTVGAVFEGIRAYANPSSDQDVVIFRLQEHLARLKKSMALVRLRLDYSLPELTEIIVELLRMNEVREDTYIRPLAYTANVAGKRFSEVGGEAGLLINTSRMPSHLKTGVTQTAAVSSWRRISDEVMPPRIKNLSNYRNGQLASMEARAHGYDIGLLLNTGGTVAEAPGACVMFVADGKLITPHVTSSILESITRDALMVLAREVLGLEVIERAVDRTELYLADEVFTCGTAAEITPITEIDKYQIGDGRQGTISRDLEHAFHAVLRGQDPRYRHWSTPVHAAASVLA